MLASYWRRIHLADDLEKGGQVQYGGIVPQRARPHYSPLTQNIAELLILQRRTDEALKVIQQLPAGHRRDTSLALAYFVRGDVVEGDAMLARLLALGETPGVDSEVALDIAEVYVVKNDLEQAFKWLDFARSRLQSKDMPIAGKELKWNLQTAPFLKVLHADPRWSALLASIHAP